MKKINILIALCFLCIFSQTLLGEASKKPRVSIITSVFDPEDFFIRDFLADIVRQTIFHECELLLIHPPSAGNAQAIIQEYMQRYPNIRYIKLDRDPGVYGCWNLGIRLAKADFVTNANLDDRRNPYCLEMHAKALEEDPNISLVYSSCFVTQYPNETFEKNHTCSIMSTPEFAPHLIYICLPGPMPMWRKSVHNYCGFFREDFLYAADHEMWLRMVSCGMRLKKAVGCSGLYYLNPQGLSTNQNSEKVQRREKEQAIMIEMYSYLWKQ